jgi:predicted acyltransferase (DUF342 family)
MRSEARTGACALSAFMLTSLCLRTEAAAATIDCGPKASVPCTFGITDPGIQLSNGAIKFQARVTQGRNTVSDGEISQVTVELVDGASNVLCTQTFGKVAVRNSILNLDFQPSGCALDNVVAKTSDLAFKLVLAGSALKPIPIGTVPYALKSNYAVKAQETHKADVAAQAHYAHRITADRQTLATNSIGTGYFDFFTPGTGGNLYDATQFQSYLNDGFMQWTPVQGQSSLHLCAKGVNDDELAKLDALYLESKNTTAHGAVVIDPPEAAGTPPVGLTVKSGGAAVTGFTSLNSGALVSGGLLVTDSTFGSDADLICEGDARVVKMLAVGGDETVGGSLTVNSGALVNGGLIVTATAPGGKDLVCNGNAEVDKDLHVLGAETVEGRLRVNGGGAIISGGLTASGGITLHNGTLLNGGLFVTDTAPTGTAPLICRGNTRLDKNLTVGGDETVAGQLAVANNASVSGSVSVGGDESVTGHLAVSGGAEVNGGAVVRGGTTMHNGAMANGGLVISDSAPQGTAPLICRGDTRLEKNLSVGGDETVGGQLAVVRNVTVNGNVSVGGDESVTGRFAVLGGAEVSGALAVGANETVGGSLTVSGDAVFRSAVSFLGPVNLGAPMASTGNSGPAVSGVSTDYVGVYGDSINAYGVEGRSATSSGVHGSTSSSNSANAGVLGITSSTNREVAGVKGVNTSVGYGVVGSSPDGVGVYGQSTKSVGVEGTSRSSTGVFGASNSGSGVFGSSISSAGVFGDSSSGNGVIGQSYSGDGVHGSSNFGIGIQGYSSTSYGGWFGSNGTRAPLHVEPSRSGQALPSAANSTNGDIVVLSDGTLNFFDGTAWKKVTLQ